MTDEDLLKAAEESFARDTNNIDMMNLQMQMSIAASLLVIARNMVQPEITTGPISDLTLKCTSCDWSRPNKFDRAAQAEFEQHYETKHGGRS